MGMSKPTHLETLVIDKCKSRSFELDEALGFFNFMILMRNLPSIVAFNHLLGAVSKMKQYDIVILHLQLLFYVYIMKDGKVKQPGLEFSTVQSELDFSYRQHYQGVTISEAYERLILDTYDPCLSWIRGDQQHFVRRDELKIHPVMVDVGTNNLKLIDNPLYLGLRQPRLEGEKYLSIIDEFIEAVLTRWPKDIIQVSFFQK
ncbi:glucose-6-phosphate 1-dehydrogenase-like [Hibiscus syriacus]|uniref:glucose-6-phosphate 1-dehydrogenase-like n=1 Tax=Hibiscus syriacus TaxID=106335 RepID=UPI0019220B3E|nr:glucose-6-phosphate 1-dehydrogenase-like [Hibiscus syriacus]